MPETMRLFIAVDAEPNHALEKVISQLGEMGKAVKPVSSRNLHLTLKFLGDVSADRIPDIIACLQNSIQSRSAFEVQLSGLGAFPHTGRPSVVWAGIADGEPLVEIAKSLESNFADIGFPPEDRDFHPHLTLARIKFRPPAELPKLFEKHESTDFGRVNVSAIHLFESELKPQGPVYTVLESVPLT